MVSSIASQPEPMATMTSVRIGRADIIEQVIVTAGELADFVHICLQRLRERRHSNLFARFAVLEVNIRVLGGAVWMTDAQG